MSAAEQPDLLFFDTFSHDTSEELNLDLVQFPKSVFVREIRIIPLGARVEGDFPGGVRLGATNPTKFHIDFFVNDLSKPGASTFEALGSIDYCQNGQIHMECGKTVDTPRIPTDGLVLRGRYTTITLAVYGNLTQVLIDTPIGANPPSTIQRPVLAREVAPIPTATVAPTEWGQEAANPIPAYTGNVAASNPDVYGANSYPPENYENQMYRNDYYGSEPPKDPRTSYIETNDWEKDHRDLSSERDPDRLRHTPRSIELDRDRERRDGRSRRRSLDRARSRESSRLRDRSRELDRIDRIHSRSRSRERERDFLIKGEYRPLSRSRSRSIDRERLRSLSNDRDWDRGSYKKDDYRRHRDPSYDRSRGGSYEPRSPYDKRAPSYERKASYEKRGPSYEKRLSPYNKRSSSYERRAPSYEKQPAYERRRHSPYGRVRSSSYGSRSPSRDDPRRRPRSPPAETSRRPVSPRDAEVASPINSIRSGEADDYERSGKQIPRVDFYHPSYRHKTSIRSPSQEVETPFVDKPHSTLVTVPIVDNPPPPKEIESPPPRNVDEDRSMEAEEFEPILSDEDICDDLEGPSYMDVDYEVNDYCAVDDIIKYYNPYKSQWTKYNYANKIQVLASNKKEGVEDVLTASFEELCDASPELFKISEMTKAAKKMEQKFHANTFIEIDNVIREEWVHQCEQLFLTFTNLSNSSDIVLRIFCDHKKYSDANEFSDIFNYLITFCQIGLNFEFALAQQQPTYKIRHIKCGVRLAESLMSHKHNGLVTSMMLSIGLDLPMLLLEMYSKEYMALSIRLMVLKALNACLASKDAVKHFMKERVFPRFDKNDNSNERKPKNGYQALISIMETNPLGRIKFAISALIKKLNMYELLSKLYELVLQYNKSAAENDKNEDNEFSDKDIDFIVRAFEEIIYMYRTQCFHLSQPKRFLPVAAQFEISKECSNEILLEFFKTHKILEVCLYLLNCPTTCSNLVIISPIHDLIHELVHSQSGLNFLYNNMEMSELLFKTLSQPYGQQNADEFLYPHDLSSYSELQILGFELAYRLKSLYYLQSICDIQAGKVDENELIDRLQSLYCLTFGNIGKTAVPDVIVMGTNAECLMNVFESDLRTRNKNESPSKQKSPAKGYAIELIVSAVRLSADVPFLKKYGPRLIKASQEHDRFEPSVSSVLQEAIPYLKPIEKPSVIAGEDLAECIEIIKASTEHAADLPGELTTCLRILRHYCISDYEKNISIATESAVEEYVELKYKYNVLQLFSLDGVANLCAILERVTTAFEQPAMHVALLASARGLQLAQLLLPCLRLLDDMLSRAVRCRGPKYRDLTAAPLLLKAYGLARAFPIGAAGRRPASRAAEAAVKALLAYAQPAADDAADGDSIRRGPWTSLCSEVISYTMTAPYTFVSGLAVFSELLPLPLPLPARVPPSAREQADAANERRMWSAHLHALSSDLIELVQAIAGSTCRPVVHMLRRVCVQVADLAPNTANTVAKAAVNAVTKELKANEPATATAARVLGFLACLVSHAPVKCAVLQSMRTGSTGGTPSAIVSALCNVLSTVNASAEHAAAQEFAAHALAALCDVEVSLCNSGVSQEQLAADALPDRTSLDALLDATGDCVTGSKGAQSAAVLRAYFVLAETETGFGALRRFWSKKKGVLGGLGSWAAVGGSGAALEAAALLAELARALREPTATRRNILTQKDLADLLAVEPGDEHPVRTMHVTLKDKNADDDVIQNALYLSEQLNAVQTSDVPSEVIDVPIATPTPLINQFAARQIVTVGHAHDERLTATYWLNVPMASEEDDVSDSDLVWCDIASVTSEVTGSRTVIPAPATDRRPHVCVALSRVRGEAGSAGAGGADAFRSRPPNTSRPPSLHVDDFTALHQPYTAARGLSSARRRFPPAAHHYRQLRSRGAWEGGHFGHAPPAHYLMGSMGWAGARMQRGPRHRTFMR